MVIRNPGTESTLTVKGVPDEIHDALDAGDDSKSETVRQILADWYDGQRDDSPDAYHPQNEDLAEVYAAAWDVCNEELILSMRRHGSTLRQRCQMGEEALRGALNDLQRRGYVARTAAWPGASNAEGYHIKPPSADPDQWKYRVGAEWEPREEVLFG